MSIIKEKRLVVFVSSPEQSRRAQRAMFKAGYKWNYTSTVVKNTDRPVLIGDTDGELLGNRDVSARRDNCRNSPNRWEDATRRFSGRRRVLPCQ